MHSVLAGAGSFEIPVLCLLVHGEPKILQVRIISLCSVSYSIHLQDRYLFYHMSEHSLILKSS